ncbi:MAG: glycosyltransferase [Bacteroidetes bacterium]|nr:MAG: glycosyltransferase [Bacteroidota bacterium]
MYVVVIIAGTLLIAGYLLLISLFIRGWRINSAHSQKQQPSKLWVSVVVAVRNEENNILTLLQSLWAQQYPNHLYEVIIIDDFSSDQTPALVAGFISDKENFHLITPTPLDTHGKKAALDRAIAQSRGNIIVTTDADCTMGVNWLYSIMQEFEQSGTKLVIAPVTIEDSSKCLFSLMQTLEFMSLTGATGGAAGMGNPIMCNGANMAFAKEARSEVMSHVSGNSYASGDDVFLMHAIKKKYPAQIRFLKNKEALVFTLPAKTIREFFSQRIRWAGKSAGYSDPFTLVTGAVVAGLNVFIVLMAVLTLTMHSLAPALLVLALLKLAIDGVLLTQVAVFLSRKKLLLLYPLLAIMYPFYVCTTLLLSLVKPYKWKQRRM